MKDGGAFGAAVRKLLIDGVPLRIALRIAAAGFGVAVIGSLVGFTLLGFWYDVNWAKEDAHRILQTAHIENSVVVPGLTRIIPTREGIATQEDGVSFGGMSFLARMTYSKLRLEVQVYVSSDEPTEAVVAVFVNEQRSPLRIVSKPLLANKREKIELTVEIAEAGPSPRGLDFRIGPARSGALTLNGPLNSSQRVASTITVTEIGG